jgi:hypothetical protein
MTKAERFKLQADRAAQAKKAKRKPRSVPPRTARSKRQARTALLERSDGPSGKLPHNTALRETKGNAYMLEATRGRRPPRLSTRKSRNKADNPLRIRATDRTVSPGARAARSKRRTRRRKV